MKTRAIHSQLPGISSLSVKTKALASHSSLPRPPRPPPGFRPASDRLHPPELRRFSSSRGPFPTNPPFYLILQAQFTLGFKALTFQFSSQIASSPRPRIMFCSKQNTTNKQQNTSLFQKPCLGPLHVGWGPQMRPLFLISEVEAFKVCGELSGAWKETPDGAGRCVPVATSGFPQGLP